GDFAEKESFEIRRVVALEHAFDGDLAVEIARQTFVDLAHSAHCDAVAHLVDASHRALTQRHGRSHCCRIRDVERGKRKVETGSLLASGLRNQAISAYRRMRPLDGHTQGLKAHQLKRLEAIFRRKVKGEALVSVELARHLADIAREL